MTPEEEESLKKSKKLHDQQKRAAESASELSKTIAGLSTSLQKLTEDLSKGGNGFLTVGSAARDTIGTLADMEVSMKKGGKAMGGLTENLTRVLPDALRTAGANLNQVALHIQAFSVANKDVMKGFADGWMGVFARTKLQKQMEDPERVRVQETRIAKLYGSPYSAGMSEPQRAQMAMRAVATGTAGEKTSADERRVSLKQSFAALMSDKNISKEGKALAKNEYTSKIKEMNRDQLKMVSSTKKAEINLEDDVIKKKTELAFKGASALMKSNDRVVGSMANRIAKTFPSFQRLAVKEQELAETGKDTRSGYEKAASTGISGMTSLLSKLAPVTVAFMAISAAVNVFVQALDRTRATGGQALGAQAASGIKVSMTYRSMARASKNLTNANSDLKSKFALSSLNMDEFNQKALGVTKTLYSETTPAANALAGSFVRIAAMAPLAGMEMDKAMGLGAQAVNAFNLKGNQASDWFMDVRNAAGAAGMNVNSFTEALQESVDTAGLLGGSGSFLTALMGTAVQGMGPKGSVAPIKAQMMMRTIGQIGKASLSDQLGWMVAGGQADTAQGAFDKLKGKKGGKYFAEVLRGFQGTVQGMSELGLSIYAESTFGPGAGKAFTQDPAFAKFFASGGKINDAQIREFEKNMKTADDAATGLAHAASQVKMLEKLVGIVREVAIMLAKSKIITGWSPFSEGTEGAVLRELSQTQGARGVLHSPKF